MVDWKDKKRNWDKPVRYELDNKERKQRAEEVAEWVENETGKGGKAQAGRNAIDLAHERIERLEAEEEKRKEVLAEHYEKVNRVAEKLKK